ncbi:MAG TPA: hypothetical protein VHO25_20345 [Polyangiaceae bacterium]|nr:hypothetical protein [Polyangiaceae bacterium]
MAGAGPGGATASSGSGGAAGQGIGGVQTAGGSMSVGGTTTEGGNTSSSATGGGGVSAAGGNSGGTSAGGMSAGGLHVDCFGAALKCRNGTVFESLNQAVPFGSSCERMVYSCMGICRVAEVTVAVGEALPPPGSLCYGWQPDAGVGGSGGVGN